MASNDEKASSSSSSSSSSWWGNFLKVAKEKSSSTFEIIKHDFAEFTTTMSNDTSSLLNSAKNNPIINSLLRTDDNEEKSDQPTRTKKDSKLSTATTIQDRFKQDLLMLQSNESTYLSDPSHEDFKEWSETFDPESFKTTISELLIDDSSMRSLYSQLVPAQISNIQFWSRYYFKVKQLEEEHKSRLKLLEKAENDAEVAKDKLEDLDWGDDNNEANDDINKETKTVHNDTSLKGENKQEVPVETKENNELVFRENNFGSETEEKPIESKPEESADDWEVTSDTEIKLKREESENKKFKQEQEQDPTDSIVPEKSLTGNSESNRKNSKNEKTKDKTQKEEQEDAEWDDWE